MNQEIIDGNKLIEVFYNGHNINDEGIVFENKLALYKIHECKFHSSWNWLMPVIQKIRKMMPEIKMPQDLELLTNGTHPSDNYTNVLSLPICSEIKEVWEAVVEFIQWYNEKSPNQH